GGLTGTVVIAEEKMKEKAGIYRSLTNGELRRITLREGNLWIDDLTMLTASLKPLSETRFTAGPDGSWVEFESAGAKTKLRLSRNNRKPETFERVEAFEPGAGQLNEFAGSYYSEHLNTTYRMSVEEGRLFVIDRNGVKSPLTPTIRDSFAVIADPQFELCPQFEFSRDDAGKVFGFAVHADRIRNVRFSKSVNSR